jgi:hypothetical protein
MYYYVSCEAYGEEYMALGCTRDWQAAVQLAVGSSMHDNAWEYAIVEYETDPAVGGAAVKPARWWTLWDLLPGRLFHSTDRGTESDHVLALDDALNGDQVGRPMTAAERVELQRVEEDDTSVLSVTNGSCDPESPDTAASEALLYVVCEHARSPERVFAISPSWRDIAQFVQQRHQDVHIMTFGAASPQGVFKELSLDCRWHATTFWNYDAASNTLDGTAPDGEWPLPSVPVDADLGGRYVMTRAEVQAWNMTRGSGRPV